MTSGSYLFKHFLRILSEWPTETGKGSSRNLKVFLEAKANVLFQPLPQQQGEAQTGQRHNDSADRMIAPGVSVIECKRQLEALQQLANSQHQRDFPVPYTSGMFGYSRETIQQMNSDEGLKKLRIYVEGASEEGKCRSREKRKCLVDVIQTLLRDNGKYEFRLRQNRKSLHY